MDPAYTSKPIKGLTAAYVHSDFDSYGSANSPRANLPPRDELKAIFSQYFPTGASESQETGEVEKLRVQVAKLEASNVVLQEKFDALSKQFESILSEGMNSLVQKAMRGPSRSLTALLDANPVQPIDGELEPIPEELLEAIWSDG